MRSHNHLLAVQRAEHLVQIGDGLPRIRISLQRRPTLSHFACQTFANDLEPWPSSAGQSSPFRKMATVAQPQRAAGAVGQLLRVVDSQMMQQSRTNVIGIERPIDGMLGLAVRGANHCAERTFATRDEHRHGGRIMVASENKVHIHDLPATLLHALGLDHERLTYRHAGRDFRLTDVEGNVVRVLFV